MESKYEEYLKAERLMESCLNYDVELKVKSVVIDSSPFQPDFSAHNKVIDELLKVRKEVVKRYFEKEVSQETKCELIQLFLKYNEEIRRIVGL